MVEPGYAGKVLVAGTGRMAFDIGLFFLGRGATVHWLSRSEARAATARTELERLLRRRQLVEPDTTEADRVALGWLAAEGGPVWVRPVSGNHGSALRPDDGEAGAQVPPSPYDLVIESSVEDPAVKRELARALAPLGGPDTFWLGTSSSVMPDI